jgi:diguanylate cyclase (GGDEF)-like protein
MSTADGRARPSWPGRADRGIDGTTMLRAVRAPRWMPRAIPRLLVRARRDPQSLLTLGLIAPVVLLESITEPERRLLTFLLAIAYAGFDVAAASLRHPPRSTPEVRLAAALVFLFAANAGLDRSGTWPLMSLVIPVTALAAARGWPGGSLIVTVAISATFLAPLWLDADGFGPDRRLAIAISELAIALVTRRLVDVAERSAERSRLAHRRSRRRATSLTAVEEVGRLLAREGPTPATLDQVMELFERTFGFRYPSIYFWDGTMLRIAAHRNYRFPIAEFPPDRGVLGRVVRTREPAFVPDVSLDPDFLSADPEVTGEICVPLLNGEEILGAMNVESGPSRPLDHDDFATMLVVGDRIAAALALGRERQKLAERSALLDRLTLFATALGATLDPRAMRSQVAAGAKRVIESPTVLLVLHDDASEYRVVDVEGGDPGLVGVRVAPGEGVSGRAIERRQPVLEDRHERRAFPAEARDARSADVLAALSVPLVADRDVLGALTWFRDDLTRPFTEQEREIAVLLASKVVLALANADLHERTREAAVRDALTGLHNRRFFDAALAHADAVRERVPASERTPRAAIMFDLDHFGAVNKDRGFPVGDRVLRRFAEILGARVRTADLMARIGGEEFMVVLEGATADDARRVAEEIRVVFAAAPVPATGGPVAVTVSAGAAELGPNEVDSRLLLERADSALRRAKRAGRDRVAVSYASASGTPSTLKPPST